MITRRNALRATIAVASLPIAGRAWAQRPDPAYPTRPIRVVVPFTPGGGTDLLMRLIGQSLATRLGRNLVIDNVGGAGGTIGAMQVVHASSDGYSLLCGTPGSIAINPVVQAGIGYDPRTDLSPIAQLTDSPVVLVCNNGFDLKSVGDLVERAKAAPGKIAFGSAGPGSLSHLSGAMFCAITGAQLVHVPYRGTGQSLVDLRAGRIQVLFENMPAVMSAIGSGLIKAIAVGTAQPSDLLPQLPTIAATGAPGYVSSSYTGILAPAKTPDAVLERVSIACAETLQDAELSKRLHALGATPTPSSPAEFGAFIAQRIADVTKVAHATGLGFN
ncbi:MAG: Bug family tripartite tricarboxylate transporter substrate binding protein [Janthinobacterium lividum]